MISLSQRIFRWKYERGGGLSTLRRMKTRTDRMAEPQTKLGSFRTNHEEKQILRRYAPQDDGQE